MSRKSNLVSVKTETLNGFPFPPPSYHYTTNERRKQWEEKKLIPVARSEALKRILFLESDDVKGTKWMCHPCGWKRERKRIVENQARWGLKAVCEWRIFSSLFRQSGVARNRGSPSGCAYQLCLLIIFFMFHTQRILIRDDYGLEISFHHNRSSSTASARPSRGWTWTLFFHESCQWQRGEVINMRKKTPTHRHYHQSLKIFMALGSFLFLDKHELVYFGLSADGFVVFAESRFAPRQILEKYCKVVNFNHLSS